MVGHMTFTTERGPIECSWRRFKHVLIAGIGLLVAGFFVGAMVFDHTRHWGNYIAPLLLFVLLGICEFWMVILPWLRSHEPISEC